MTANKSLGQHWLKNRAVLEEIAELAVGDKGEKICVEIGPGLGTLTSSLLKRFERVIAVEYDKKLAENLPGSFPGTKLEVVNEDILKFDFDKISEPFVVAGNIPYYITSPIITKVLASRAGKAVFLIQKEVAERIASEAESVLSLTVKNVADVKLGPVVPKEEFDPAPKVDSQVIILEPHAPIVDEKVMKMIRIAFAAPRKKVTRNLSTIVPREDIKMSFVRNNINIDVRPHELHLNDWQKVYDELRKMLGK